MLPVPALGFDHLVLVARDVERTIRFYVDVLGAEAINLERWRDGEAEYPALGFAGWKFNVHPESADLAPRARRPEPGAVDVCLRWPGAIEDAQRLLSERGVRVEHGPVSQDGAAGPGTSVYFRDPDHNLVELISYACGPEAG